jgi:hypothetical protein
MPAEHKVPPVDGFAVVGTTGFNKWVFQFVESKGLPQGQPAGPEPEERIFAKPLKMRHLQLQPDEAPLLKFVEGRCFSWNLDALSGTESSTAATNSLVTQTAFTGGISFAQSGFGLDSHTVDSPSNSLAILRGIWSTISRIRLSG